MPTLEESLEQTTHEINKLFKQALEHWIVSDDSRENLVKNLTSVIQEDDKPLTDADIVNLASKCFLCSVLLKHPEPNAESERNVLNFSHWIKGFVEYEGLIEPREVDKKDKFYIELLLKNTIDCLCKEGLSIEKRRNPIIPHCGTGQGFGSKFNAAISMTFGVVARYDIVQRSTKGGVNYGQSHKFDKNTTLRLIGVINTSRDGKQFHQYTSPSFVPSGSQQVIGDEGERRWR